MQRELARPPIPDGSRNIALTRVAGALHDGTRTLEELTEDLHAVNKARCEHDAYGRQLSRREVGWIAKSIHRRPPCTPGKGRPPEEIADFVYRHWIGVLSAGTWKGQAGGSNYTVYEALLEVAELHAWITEHGAVCVSVSVRELAMRAGVSTRTCIKALQRLQEQHLLYRVPMPTKGTAGRLILRDVAGDLTPEFTIQSTSKEAMLSGEGLSELLTALKRFRSGAGRITPTMLLHVRCLAFLGEEGADVAWVSRVLERRPDNVRRTLRALETRGIVEARGRNSYRIPYDLLARLELALIEDRIPDTERAQRRRNDDEREAYKKYTGEAHKQMLAAIGEECGAERSPKPDHAPDEDELERAYAQELENDDDFRRRHDAAFKEWQRRQQAEDGPVELSEPIQRPTALPAASKATQDAREAPKTGPEITAEFEAANHHPLTCNCALCSVIDLGQYQRERVA